MINESKKDYLNEKVIQLSILKNIEYQNQIINSINTRIKFYRTLLNHLEDSKPLFFQKKKLIEYSNKIKEYNDKIDALYIELDDELLSVTDNCSDYIII